MQQIFKNVEICGKKVKKIKKGQKNSKKNSEFFAPPFRKAGYNPVKDSSMLNVGSMNFAMYISTF